MIIGSPTQLDYKYLKMRICIFFAIVKSFNSAQHLEQILGMGSLKLYLTLYKNKFKINLKITGEIMDNL